MSHLFIPVIDNGMGLSRTAWAVSSMLICLGPLRKHTVTLEQFSYPYPAGAMNKACNAFLETDAEEMLLIDTDLVFNPQHLEWLLSHDEPLVFGMYPKRLLGLHFPLERLPGSEFAPNPLAPDVNPLVEVAGVARGFMRMHRSVLEKIAPQCAGYRDPDTDKECLEFWRTQTGDHSEDFAFCKRWRDLGGRVLVDQRCTVEHEGSARFPIRGTF